MATEILFCFQCDAPRDCEIERGEGMTIWRCPVCGGIVDEDYDDMDENEDDLSTCYACGGAKDEMLGLLCSKCRGGRTCPSCHGDGDMYLKDEGGNGMYWQCPTCRGKGTIEETR